MFVIDTIEETEKIEHSMQLLKLFTFISLSLAFFCLAVSIAGNINDSTYEIAVLRAIGMKNDEMVIRA